MNYRRDITTADKHQCLTVPQTRTNIIVPHIGSAKMVIFMVFGVISAQKLTFWCLLDSSH